VEDEPRVWLLTPTLRADIETLARWLGDEPVPHAVAALATWLEFELLLGVRSIELRGAQTPEPRWTWTVDASALTKQPTKLYAIEAKALATQIVAVADRELVGQEAEVRGLGWPHRPGKRPYRLHDRRREMLGEVFSTIGDASTLGGDRDRLELVARLLDVLATDERLARLADTLTSAEVSLLQGHLASRR
jgi:hypothetical protein